MKISYDEFNKLIIDMKQKNKTLIIGIDGVGASGKTSLSKLIKKLNNDKVTIFHIDDFYLPFNLRSKERMDTIGGNVDWERFREEVLNRINYSNKYIETKKFSCKTSEFSDIKEIIHDIVIVEGVFSLRNEFKDFYDLKIYLEISEELRIERITNRNGIENLDVWLNKWIPNENKYFNSHNPKAYSDIIIDSTNFNEGINLTYKLMNVR